MLTPARAVRISRIVDAESDRLVKSMLPSVYRDSYHSYICNTRL